VPEVHITAQTRNEFGKGAARRIRRAGLVPAVLYGHGTDTRHVTLPGHELMLALKTPNVLLYLDGLKSGSEIALPKAVQRDPIKGYLEQLVRIPVEAEATSIPQGIEVDVEGMEIGASVHAGDLKLPSGVTLQVDPEALVLHVVAQPTAEEPEAEAAEALEVPEAVADEAAAGEGEQAG